MTFDTVQGFDALNLGNRNFIWRTDFIYQNSHREIANAIAFDIKKAECLKIPQAKYLFRFVEIIYKKVAKHRYSHIQERPRQGMRILPRSRANSTL